MPRYIDADKFIKKERELYCKNCDRRFGTKNGKLKEIYQIGDAPCDSCELNDALDSLDDFPAADVEPVRHGHWIKTGSSRYGHFLFFECSECKRIESCEYDEKIEKIAPYCHCGAKMDGKENE